MRLQITFFVSFFLWSQPTTKLYRPLRPNTGFYYFLTTINRISEFFIKIILCVLVLQRFLYNRKSICSNGQITPKVDTTSICNFSSELWLLHNPLNYLFKNSNVGCKLFLTLHTNTMRSYSTPFENLNFTSNVSRISMSIGILPFLFKLYGALSLPSTNWSALNYFNDLPTFLFTCYTRRNMGTSRRSFAYIEWFQFMFSHRHAKGGK